MSNIYDLRTNSINILKYFAHKRVCVVIERISRGYAIRACNKSITIASTASSKANCLTFRGCFGV